MAEDRSEDKIKAEITELRKKISDADRAYYVESNPIMPDIEYDRLFDRLKKLEADNPQFYDDDSPTSRIGSDIDNELPEREHTIPVLSLDKCYSCEDLADWIVKTGNKTGNDIELIVEPKIDGAGVVLYYENGRLDRALTRGNGYVGNDITANIKTIKSVPLTVDNNETFAVRAEVFMTREDFQSFNKRMGDEKYSNPRNLASGSVRRQKSSEAGLYPLKILCYEGFFPDKQKNHIEILMELKNLGFPLNDYIGYFSEHPINLALPFKHGVTGGIKDIDDYVKKFKTMRQDVPYDIDGLVIKINDISAREKLGFTQHHPRWAIAYKFEAPLAETVVESIDVQIGRQGRATPVANLKPVSLAGSVISRATLHNQDYIDSLDVNAGDRVSISKRGDVIPAVEEVIEKGNNVSSFQIRDECPVCKTKLIKDGAHLFCPNEECAARQLGILRFFAARSQMDIESLGNKTLEILFLKGFVKSIPDIYPFDYSSLLEFEGYKEKKINNIAGAVEKSKGKDFITVLSSLSLKDIGARVSELLVNEFGDIDSIIAAAAKRDIETFTSIEGIGEEISKSIINHFNNPKTLSIIETLKKSGLKFKKDFSSDLTREEKFLAGTKWVITGSFEKYRPREKAGELIKLYGGEILQAVTSGTTHLLCGDKPGSKLDRARELKIRVINENEFDDIIYNKKI